MRRELLSLLAILSTLATIVLAGSGEEYVGVRVHGPLDKFNLTGCFYRGMNISLSMWLANWLSSASPPMCPNYFPVDAMLTCGCSLEPSIWWPNQTWSLVLGEKWSSTLSTIVPEEAALENASVGFSCSCSWAEWCTSVTVSTSYSTSYWRCGYTTITQCWPPPRGCETYTSPVTCSSTTSTTVTVTVTSTLLVTATVMALDDITVTPRVVNSTYLPIDVTCNWSQPGVPGECRVMVYNLAGGVVLNRTMLLPRLVEGLMLHNPCIEVVADTVAASECVAGYAWTANTNTEPAYELNFSLIPPVGLRTIGMKVYIEATADNSSSGEAYRERLEYNYTIVYPYGWLLILDDNCTLQRYEPVREPTVKTWINDTLSPTYHVKDNTIVFEDPGRCGMLSKIVIYRDTGVYSVLEPRGRLYRLNAAMLPPGNYTLVAVDQAGHRLKIKLHVEQPQQSLQLAPILVLLTLLAGLGIMTGRKWVRV